MTTFYETVKFDRQNSPDALRVLNLGELGDPLAVDDITGLSEQLVLSEGEWFSDCRSRKIAISERMQNRDVPRDCGRDSPLQQEGPGCALQRDSAGLESRWFGRERTVLQLYGLKDFAA